MYRPKGIMLVQSMSYINSKACADLIFSSNLNEERIIIMM